MPWPLISTAEQLKGRTTLNQTTGCWEWSKKLTGCMRPYVQRHGKKTVASRLMYMLHFDVKIPSHLFVCHKCDNPICLNPAHLFLGTNQDNMDDMDAKGRPRGPSSENSRHAVLTDRIVESILGRLELGERQTTIAKEYGVSRSCVCDIWRGKTWSHLTGDRHSRTKEKR